MQERLTEDEILILPKKEEREVYRHIQLEMMKMAERGDRRMLLHSLFMAFKDIENENKPLQMPKKRDISAGYTHTELTRAQESMLFFHDLQNCLSGFQGSLRSPYSQQHKSNRFEQFPKLGLRALQGRKDGHHDKVSLDILGIDLTRIV